MSPAKSCDINGPRPSPLLIHKDSRLIRKPSPPPPQLRQPVIIYTHSPKIIHTQPKDFMALVQRLTGLTPPPPPQPPSDRNNVNYDNDSSSVLTEEVNCGDHHHQASSTYVKEVQSQNHSFLADVPLFTPRSSDLFASPRASALRYAADATSFASPGLPNSLSPSFVEFLKGLPEF